MSANGSLWDRVVAWSQPRAKRPRASGLQTTVPTGVGAGTLYRQFPTREALILAVYQHDVQRLVESVPALLSEQPPLRALRLWFEELAGYVKIKHGLGDALHAATAEDIVSETYGPVTNAIGQLLRACEDAGSVRPGLDPGDVLLLMGFLWRTGPGEEGKAQATRLLDLVIDSLRASPEGSEATGGRR